MVTVGIAGLGPDWESRHRPALRTLRGRIGVRALYDPVAGRAAQVADEWNTRSVDGLLALSERTDVRALLLLDAGWHGFEAVRLLSRAGKPLLVGSGLVCDAAAIGALHEAARLRGQTIVPAFGLRYTPASSRLRELLATRLGSVQAITIEATSSGGRSAGLLGLVDWCRYVVGSSPIRVNAAPGDSENGSREPQSIVQIEFTATNGSAGIVRAELKLQRKLVDERNSTADLLHTSNVQASVACSGGTATIESPTRIVWQDGGEPVRETLSSDRGEIEVLLDLFCRRVVGGLIPAPDLSDVLSGVRVLEAAQRSRETGRPVDLVD